MPSLPSNHLIDSLPPLARDAILQRCETVHLPFGAILCEPQEAFRHAYFPLTAFISLVATVKGHEPLEMGLIGNEGMLGATLVLGIPAAPLRGVVQGAGTALKLTVRKLRGQLRSSPPLLHTLNRYLYVLSAQLAQTAICTRFHEIEARLSRWLLMTDDRAGAEHFHLTHTFLAGMLGVQRSAVTIAAGKLQGRKLIRYSRGDIVVLDRPGLEAASCECYKATITAYQRFFA